MRDPHAWIATIAILDTPTVEPLQARTLSSEAGLIAWQLDSRERLPLFAMPSKLAPMSHEGARPIGWLDGTLRVGNHLLAEGSLNPELLALINQPLLTRFESRRPLACGVDLSHVEIDNVGEDAIVMSSWRLRAVTLHDNDDDVSWPEICFVRNDKEAWKTLAEIKKGRPDVR